LTARSATDTEIFEAVAERHGVSVDAVEKAHKRNRRR
jgi:hypothetical protein